MTALVLFHTSSDLHCDNVPPALDGSVVKRLPAPPPLLLSSLLVNQLKPSTAAPLPGGCWSPAVTQSGLVADCNPSHQLFLRRRPPFSLTHARAPSPPSRARCEGGFNFSLTDVTQAVIRCCNVPAGFVLWFWIGSSCRATRLWWEIGREVEEEQGCGGEERILHSSTHNELQLSQHNGRLTVMKQDAFHFVLK